MVSDVRTEAELIAEELHEFLQSMDPARARRELSQRFREHAESLRARIEVLLAEMKEEPRVCRISESLRNLAEHLEEVGREGLALRRDFMWNAGKFERIQPAYAALVAA